MVQFDKRRILERMVFLSHLTNDGCFQLFWHTISPTWREHLICIWRKNICGIILLTIRTNWQWFHLKRPIDLLWSQLTFCLCWKRSLCERARQIYWDICSEFISWKRFAHMSHCSSQSQYVTQYFFLLLATFCFCARMWNLNQRTHILEPWIARFHTTHLVHPI